MLDIIRNNPFRILGVCSNATMKDILSNKNRMKAFMRVGKPVTFPMDMCAALGPLERVDKTIEDADSKLTIDDDKLRYAQFWLMHSGNNADNSALAKLSEGNIDMALSIWERIDNMSSLQNRAVLHMVKGDYAAASTCLSTLYGTYAKEFQERVGLHTAVPSTVLIENYVSEVTGSADSVDFSQLIPQGCSETWRSTAKDKVVEPLVKAITDAVAATKERRGRSVNDAFAAGEDLVKKTETLLARLRQLVGAGDIQYRNTADKVANEVLQCAIDYHNDSGVDNVAVKVKPMMETAQAIAVGSMARQRCKENLDTIVSNIASAVPSDVSSEDKEIRQALNDYCSKPDEIQYAWTLINVTDSPLTRIRDKKGDKDAYYLKMSSLVVNNALHNMIAEVNAKQKVFNEAQSGSTFERQAYNLYRDAVNAAWMLTQRISAMRMDADTNARFVNNRDILKGLHDQVNQTNPPAVNTGGTSTGSSSDKSIGCITQILIYLGIIFLINLCTN